MEKTRIVVMGGSFNPPTIAHLRLMEAAIRAVDAQQGIFVPVSEAYLKRKQRKSEDHIRLSESLRMEMLRAMCEGRTHLTVSDLEIRNPMLRTRETLQLLHAEAPGAKLYFLAGADKLPLLGALATGPDFCEHFGVVLFARDGTDARAMIRQDERLAPLAHAFVHAAQPEGVEGISATEARRKIARRRPEEARALLHGNVWELFRNLTPEDFPPEIERFQGEYAFLSNGFPSPVCCGGLSFSCAEAAFQAARCARMEDKKCIALGDGVRAKRIASRMEPTADWEQRKLAAMEEVVRAKFAQNPDLARKLVDTGNAVLVYGTNGKDRFWGRDLYTDCGENRLGGLLMQLREEFRKEREGVVP